MSRPALSYSIDGHKFDLEQILQYAVSRTISFDSEKDMEDYSEDLYDCFYDRMAREVPLMKQKNIRYHWVELHPPNHAGYYLCHLCGGWVHFTQSELDHLVPASVESINIEEKGWDNKLRMAHKFPQHGPDGKQYCMGNRGKGSQQVVSKTLEFIPPDTEY